ncbi:hypothetical protein DC522_14325 [Microvirga sp. KLBC 81]|nr:hypothetical protein DC522_14325 [Microvirga sp. KLBC 81]
MKRRLFAVLIPGLLILSSPAAAQQGFFAKPLVERKVMELPSGDLFWRIDTFGTTASDVKSGFALLGPIRCFLLQ